MKIVYIADIGIEGGATKSLIELVSTMKNEHGVVPIVLTSGNGRLNQSLTELGIENYAVGQVHIFARCSECGVGRNQ